MKYYKPLDEAYVPAGFMQKPGLTGNSWYFNSYFVVYVDEDGLTWQISNKELQQKIENILVAAYKQEESDLKRAREEVESLLLTKFNEIHRG